jgi:transcriptional regulator with XRE-family HTH domain
LDESAILKEELEEGLGGRLSRHIRGHKSVRAFARECGVSPTYISLVENDLYRMSPRVLRHLLNKVPARAAGLPKNGKKS